MKKGQSGALTKGKGIGGAGNGSTSSGARAFVQARRNANFRTSPLFNEETATDNLSENVVKLARKSGTLNLANRSLQKIPSRVWRLHEIDEKTKAASSSVSLDNPSEEKWWEFVDLQKLIVANNCIKEIPSEINLLSSLQTLDVHDNQITVVSPAIGQLGDLRKLDLSHNQLQDLPVEAFNLKMLLELKLNNNKLEAISKDIGQLSVLKHLDISFNNLVTVPEDLGFLSFLTSLNISNNRLMEIPHDFGGLTGLKELDISDNTLTRLSSSFPELLHLEVLRLQNNKLENIPIFVGCPNLKELHAQNNQFKRFKSENFANTKVELLDFRINKIQALEINKDDLDFLDRFFLDNNDLSILPDDLALLPSLKHLTLEGNPLRSIRTDILKRGTQGLLKHLRGRLSDSKTELEDSNTKLLESNTQSSESTERSPRATTQEQLGLDVHRLKNTKLLSLVSKQMKCVENQVFVTATEAKVNKIDLSKNLLTELPVTFEGLSSTLSELVLDFNRFSSLPPCLATFTNLQFLSFQNNQVDHLPGEMTGLKKLREINFGFNKFTSIPSCLYDLPMLEIIIATNNKICKIETDNLQKLSRLAVLDLSNNDIREAPPELGLLTQLRSLNIEGNAFRVPGYAVLSKGTESVLAFLRNRIQQK